MKYKDIALTANSNLRRSKLRTFLTSSAVFMGAFTLMLTIGVSFGLKTYVQEQVEAAGAKDVMIVQAKTDLSSPIGDDEVTEYDPDAQTTSDEFGSTPSLVPEDLDAITDHKGILSITPLYPVASEFITAGDKNYQASISQTLDGLIIPLKAGREVKAGGQDYEVTIPPEFVSVLGFASNEDAVNQAVDIGFKDAAGEIFTLSATVVGVQEKTIITGNTISASTSLVEAAFERASQGVPDFQRYQYIAAAAKYDITISEQELIDLQAALDEEGYSAQTLEDQLGMIIGVIDAITVFLLVFAGITLAAATFGIVNTLLMSVQERTREIGLMKALGMGRKKIFFLFSLEAVLIGLWSSLIALATANIVGRVGNNLASNSFLKDFEGLELFSFPLIPMLGIMAIVTTIAFLASTLPARRASRLNPIDALRYE